MGSAGINVIASPNSLMISGTRSKVKVSATPESVLMFSPYCEVFLSKFLCIFDKFKQTL